MTTHFDHKGKYFTDVISKDIVPATIQTLAALIRGNLHVHPQARIKDEINEGEQFIAVTDAVVYNTEGQEIHRSEFLTVNRDHIIWLSPEEEAAEAND